MEKIAIVNDTDTVTGETTIDEAHENNLLHRTLNGLIRMSNGHIILNTLIKDVAGTNTYALPVNGHIYVGESGESALFRQANEDTGLEEFDFTPMGKAIYNRQLPGKNENHFVSMYEILTDEPLQFNHEDMDTKEFTEDELKTALQEHPELFEDSVNFVFDTWYPELKKQVN